MEPTQARPWYKKKRYLIPLGLLALSMILNSGSSTPQPSQPAAAAAATIETPQPSQKATDASTGLDSAPTTHQVYSPVSTGPTKAAQPAPAPTQAASQPQQSSLSNDNYYTNADGDQVHSPAYSNSVPTGATAQCGDGTYSFSQHRSGTCSHHGGVASWL